MSLKALRYVFLVVSLGSLSGCGFHLRGAVQLPAQMQMMYIQGVPGSELILDLHRSLGSSNVQLVNSIDKADAILVILVDQVTRRVLSVGSTGRAREYELTYKVRFSVVKPDQSPLLKPEQHIIRRDFSFDENDILGKSSEELLMRQEMQRDMARLILRRLQWAGRQLDPGPSTQVQQKET